MQEKEYNYKTFTCCCQAPSVSEILDLRVVKKSMKNIKKTILTKLDFILAKETKNI